MARPREGYVYDQEIDFDTNQTATAVQIDAPSSPHVTYAIIGPDGGDFAVQGSTDGSNWINLNTHSALTGDQVNDIGAGGSAPGQGFRHYRIQITTASGTSGDIADFVLTANS